MSIRELFGSAGAISAGSALAVQVSHMDGPEGSATNGPAFSGSKTFAVGDGSYTVTTAVH